MLPAGTHTLETVTTLVGDYLDYHILTEDLIYCMGQMGISALDDAAAQLIRPATGK